MTGLMMLAAAALAALLPTGAYGLGYRQGTRQMTLRAQVFTLIEAAPADHGWMPVPPLDGYAAAARWHDGTQFVRVMVGRRGLAIVTVNDGRPQAVGLRRALAILADPAAAVTGLEGARQ